jgi:hypothetical protein
LNEELKGVRAENQKRYMDDAGSLLVADLEAENAQNKSNGSNKPAEMTEHYFANYLRKEGFDFEGFGEFNGLIDYLKSTGKIHTTEVGGIKTIRLGRDPNEPAIKAGDVADVPKVEDPKSSSQEPSEAEWSPVTHLKIAADSPKELRGVDVERLFDSAPPEKHNELADYLRDVRPDLSEAVNDIAGKPEESKQEPDEEPKKTSAAINDLEIVQKPDFKGDKRYVAYSYTPVSKKFWDENRKRKATGRASEPSKLHKDVRAAKIGDMWAVAIWGDSPEEVKARAEELQKNNLHKFSRHNRTVLKYLRLADSAKWYGDRDSARIYFDQALRFSRR